MCNVFSLLLTKSLYATDISQCISEVPNARSLKLAILHFTFASNTIVPGNRENLTYYPTHSPPRVSEIDNTVHVQ